MEDTLLAHEETCAGLAANMLGVRVRAIAFFDSDRRVRTMCNSEITQEANGLEPILLRVIIKAERTDEERKV